MRLRGIKTSASIARWLIGLNVRKGRANQLRVHASRYRCGKIEWIYNVARTIARTQP